MLRQKFEFDKNRPQNIFETKYGRSSNFRPLQNQKVWLTMRFFYKLQTFEIPTVCY